jgi:hypothetical protein
MSADLPQAMRENDWSSICRRADVHIELMSRSWSSEARAIALHKALEFVGQPPPRSHHELQHRFSQTMGLNSMRISNRC